MNFSMVGRGPSCSSALLLFASMTLPGVAKAAGALRICVDLASATAARDKAVGKLVASQAGLTLSIVSFDSERDDDGASPKVFQKLLSGACDLIMGYPVDITEASLPDGFKATKPYAQTGFVLVTAPGVTARKLADLPNNTEVAVTFEAPPNLYFVDHDNISADIRRTDAETLQAVMGGQVRAAMVWQPTVDEYSTANPSVANFSEFPLNEPHARYNVVALYLPTNAASAYTFDSAMISVEVSSSGASGEPPALYTETQAASGYAKFLGNCAMCHGTHLEGRSGPALTGRNWANDKADYTVGDVFTVVSQQMPATGPGSLAHNDYVQIMAFLLKQNGYPAGSKPLQFDDAAASTVALRYHGK